MRHGDPYRLRFCKMSGAGNDFIMINGAESPAAFDYSELARQLCRRRISVGADGIVLVEPSRRPETHIRVRFWNPDGMEAATCGNGTRCAARFAVIEGLAPDAMIIETPASDIDARVAGDIVTLRYRALPDIQLDFTVSGPEGPRAGHRVELGIPHLVLTVSEMPAGGIEPSCRPLRYAPELGEAGANVHLVEVLDRHTLRIRSYERGVEEETLACGSGSMSAAVALAAAGNLDAPVTVRTRSGDDLTIRFERDGEGRYYNLELEGPARIIYRGQLAGSELPISP
jgi:diaminopimelate epimerase